MKKRTYLISLSLAAGLALSQLTGCASSGPEETTAAESTQAPSEAETASIPNPMEEVENEQSFESMGIHMVAPADGENTKFYTISGEVAEITFDENGDANKNLAYIKTIKDGQFQFLTTTTLEDTAA